MMEVQGEGGEGGDGVGLLSPLTALKALTALRVVYQVPPLSPPSPQSRDADDDHESRDSRDSSGGESRDYGDASSTDGSHPDSPSLSLALQTWLRRPAAQSAERPQGQFLRSINLSHPSSYSPPSPSRQYLFTWTKPA